MESRAGHGRVQDRTGQDRIERRNSTGDDSYMNYPTLPSKNECYEDDTGHHETEIDSIIK